MNEEEIEKIRVAVKLLQNQKGHPEVIRLNEDQYNQLLELEKTKKVLNEH